MTQRSIVRRRAFVIVVVTLIGILIPVPTFTDAGEAKASTRPFALPIPSGDTWVVCQGYNGSISHGGTPALDLSLAPDAAGPLGCMMSTKYTSAGSEVVSPAAGIAYRTSGCCGDDFVCVDLDAGGSVAIGHLDHRVPDGTRVGTVERIGTVAWPNEANGEYAHIHIQAHPIAGCMDASEAVPFDSEHGFRFACAPDLTYSGGSNQYSGLQLSRCGNALASDDSGTSARVWKRVPEEWLRWATRRWAPTRS